jgi:hypothetical protein
MGDLDNNLFNEATEQYVESSHKFTEPIRYYKSNDPYYWEVDNIPLKQLEENILFLRDQVANNLSVSGIGRDDLRELRPFVNGTDRFVYVNPGRFTGRVNDCYNKGISMFARKIALDYRNEGGQQFGVQETNFRSQAIREEREFTIPVDVFKKLSGEIIGEPLLDNGLYSFLQHHAVSFQSGSFEWTSNNLEGISTLNQGLGVSSLPKAKAAIWRGTGSNFATIFSNDLQQESVEFTRYWGGSSRTAIVDVQDVLSIEVPPFVEDEFVNNSEFAPAARIDLLFIYTHPMDASSTTIMSDVGNSPQQITSPQLGILRGAGVISLDKGNGTYNQNYDGTPGHFDDPDYATASSVPSNYFTSENLLDVSGYKIQSTMADQLQTLVGVNANYSVVPSPDDLLNLTPLFEAALESDSLSLIGQSILPVAYIVSKRGKSVIEREDLMDIRPFLRTTELSYNERAGISAAIPPLSFANPAVGKSELRSNLLEVRDFVQTQLNEVQFRSKPVGAGTVYGGISHGPEGPLLGMYKNRFGSVDLNSDDAIISVLRDHFRYRGLGGTDVACPWMPGWDQNNYQTSVDQLKYMFSVTKIGNYDYNQYDIGFTGDSGNFNPVQSHLGIGWFGAVSPYKATHHSTLVVKRNITFAEMGITQEMSNAIDYDVNVNLVNCAPMTKIAYAEGGGNADTATEGPTWNGVSVEKRDDGFTIFVCLGHAVPQTGGVAFGRSTGGTLSPSSLGTNFNNYLNVYGKNHYDRVLVISNDFFEKSSNIINNRGNVSGQGGSYMRPNIFGTNAAGGANQTATRTHTPMLVTYPTVNFTVVKYEGDAQNSLKGFYRS